mgnify:CR=1 FL=1
MTDENRKNKLDLVIKKYENKPGRLLSVLEESQELNKHKYLEKDALEYIAGKMRLPISRIYSVITFYAFFNLEPQGDHSIIICRGTACHTRGSKNLLDDLKASMGFGKEDPDENNKPFFTTKDKKFTVRTVACFGQCALAPVVAIDENIYGHMTKEKLKNLIQKIAKGKK